jgi:hypothetical protein
MRSGQRVVLAAALCAALVTPLARADALLDRARLLMSTGKPAEAFALLEPGEASRAGEAEFDYALGIAALDAGKPDRATIAFERVLAINPNFAGARLDLARAYFAMGSDDLARGEFDAVLKDSPPSNVRAIIARYLGAIEARRKREQPALTGYMEAGGGSDSNVTAVTSGFSAGAQQAYGIPNIQPTGNSVLRSGGFTQLAGGLDYTRPIESQLLPGFGIYAGGDLRERRYQSDNGDFNWRQVDARIGMMLNREADLFRVGVQDQKYEQRGATPPAAGGDPITNDRRVFGFTAEWRHALASGRQIGVFVQSNRQRFATNPAQNLNQFLFGGQFVNVWEVRGRPLLMLSVFQSNDHALQPSNLAGTTNLSKALTGARAYAQYSLLESLDIFASVGQSERRDKTPLARSTTVEYVNDRTRDYSLGANWRATADWLLRAQLARFENRSNVQLYDYNRTEASVYLRHDFK